MVWHIFRKDVKLLWRMVIGVALINLMHRVILSSLGPFEPDASPLAVLSGILGTVTLLATGVLIVMVVQQDSILRLTQDWLVRPIRRRDLLLSKVLFVALMVQGPIFLLEIGQCLAAGFPLERSLAAPLSRSVWMFLAMDLPVLAFATLTRSLAQAAGAAIAVVVGMVVVMVATLFYLNSMLDTIWIIDSAQVAWGLAGVAVVLALQYYRRRTSTARLVHGAAALVWLFVEFLPWQPAFAIEKRLSPQPTAADAVQIAFDPDLGKLQGPSRAMGHSRGLPTADVPLWVPLRSAGLGEGQMLAADRMSVRVTRPGGTAIYIEDERGSRFILEAENPGHELIWVPEDIYNRLKNLPVTLEIDYSLTVLQAGPARAIPATGGDRWIEDVGRCATRTTAGGAEVELGCLAPDNMPCAAFSLEYNGTGQGSARGSGCRSGYAPYFARINGDSISRFAREFPSIGSELKDAQVVIRAYHPQAHFTRQVVIPNTRLSEWRPE